MVHGLVHKSIDHVSEQAWRQERTHIWAPAIKQDKFPLIYSDIQWNKWNLLRLRMAFASSYPPTPLLISSRNQEHQAYILHIMLKHMSVHLMTQSNRHITLPSHRYWLKFKNSSSFTALTLSILFIAKRVEKLSMSLSLCQRRNIKQSIMKEHFPQHRLWLKRVDFENQCQRKISNTDIATYITSLT